MERIQITYTVRDTDGRHYERAITIFRRNGVTRNRALEEIRAHYTREQSSAEVIGIVRIESNPEN